jgi:SAM-dependent methyltransferase
MPGDREFYAGLAEDRRVLEIGAGTGRVTEAIAAVARSVVAIEYAPAMLRRAADRLAHMETVRLLLADARALPLLGEFDLVALPYRVIHHLESEERRRLWRSLAAVLAEDGRVAFDSWHGPAPAGGAGRGSPPTTNIGTAELRAELERAGLAAVRTSNGFGGTGTGRSFVRAWIARTSFRTREHTDEVVDNRRIAP